MQDKRAIQREPQESSAVPPHLAWTMLNWPGGRTDSSFEEGAWASHQSPALSVVPAGPEEPHARMGHPAHRLERTKEGVSDLCLTELEKGEHLPSLAPTGSPSALLRKYSQCERKKKMRNWMATENIAVRKANKQQLKNEPVQLSMMKNWKKKRRAGEKSKENCKLHWLNDEWGDHHHSLYWQSRKS